MNDKTKTLFLYWKPLLYNSTINSFINSFVRRGKKFVALKLFFSLLLNIKKKVMLPPLLVLQSALFNYRPVLNLKTTQFKRKKHYSVYILYAHKQIKYGIRAIRKVFTYYKDKLNQDSPGLNYVEQLTLFILNLFFKSSIIYGKLLTDLFKVRIKCNQIYKNIGTKKTTFIVRKKKKIKSDRFNWRNSFVFNKPDHYIFPTSGSLDVTGGDVLDNTSVSDVSIDNISIFNRVLPSKDRFLILLMSYTFKRTQGIMYSFLSKLRSFNNINSFISEELLLNKEKIFSGLANARVKHYKKKRRQIKGLFTIIKKRIRGKWKKRRKPVFMHRLSFNNANTRLSNYYLNGLRVCGTLKNPLFYTSKFRYRSSVLWWRLRVDLKDKIFNFLKKKKILNSFKDLNESISSGALKILIDVSPNKHFSYIKILRLYNRNNDQAIKGYKLVNLKGGVYFIDKVFIVPISFFTTTFTSKKNSKPFVMQRIKLELRDWKSSEESTLDKIFKGASNVRLNKGRKKLRSLNKKAATFKLKKTINLKMKKAIIFRFKKRFINIRKGLFILNLNNKRMFNTKYIVSNTRKFKRYVRLMSLLFSSRKYGCKKSVRLKLHFLHNLIKRSFKLKCNVINLLRRISRRKKYVRIFSVIGKVLIFFYSQFFVIYNTNVLPLNEAIVKAIESSYSEELFNEVQKSKKIDIQTTKIFSYLK